MIDRRQGIAGIAVVLLAACAGHRAPPRACNGFSGDYDVFWSRIENDYAYLDSKTTDWNAVRRLDRPAAETASSKRAFLTVLERSIDELYDPHVSARANTASSPRLVPSGLDLWAEWQGGRAVITQLRSGFSADQAGLRAGDVIVAVNGQPTREAADARLGRAIERPDSAAYEWALLSALAGRHDVQRTLTVIDSARQTRTVRLDLPAQQTVDNPHPRPAVESRTLGDNIGYIALNDLIDTTTVSSFDAALEQFRNSRALILDLRNTPAGGNTSVAEPIMGRFITTPAGYQRVLPRHGKPYVREVSPRGPWTYTQRVAVLVGRWTGSMGEGVAVGFDGMHRAEVIGSRMAGLAGAVDEMHLPCSGIGVGYPGAKLLHLDGTPRERFVPPIVVPAAGTTDDAVLNRAIGWIVSRPRSPFRLP